MEVPTPLLAERIVARGDSRCCKAVRASIRAARVAAGWRSSAGADELRRRGHRPPALEHSSGRPRVPPATITSPAAPDGARVYAAGASPRKALPIRPPADEWLPAAAEAQNGVANRAPAAVRTRDL
ncbi:hypothetical protein HPB50_003828 [Hyalomma asiaticum]|uniref:Uncharacterized protein n=1 Tax=Hyalomma asiaticum TaxID=266040 RepID=A0ACB7TES1_HYAAI|nr:hypothetical protein HPB50_003828 [Hyalomma asiaticum]